MCMYDNYSNCQTPNYGGNCGVGSTGGNGTICVIFVLFILLALCRRGPSCGCN